MNFKSIVAPVSQRPLSVARRPGGLHALVRDQFSITTWLAFGGLAQTLLLYIFGPYAIIPIVFLLGYKIADTSLMTSGLTRNRYMDDVLQTKFSAQVPDNNGQFGGKAADSEIVVFLLGTRNNHPMGLLAPGQKEMGEYFMAMAKEVSENAEEYDFLAHTSWLSTNQRTGGNEMLDVMYFRSYQGLHRFAHSDVHRKGWSWYTSFTKQHPEIGIWHETYAVPKGHWESIYANSHPTNLATSVHKITDKETGEVRFASPLVDASRGLLRSSKGRMDRSDGADNAKYGLGIYEQS